MAMHSFILPFREAKFCGVPSCVFDKLVCAAGEISLQNTALETHPPATYLSRTVYLQTRLTPDVRDEYHQYLAVRARITKSKQK
jgi:hypothetical protein